MAAPRLALSVFVLMLAVIALSEGLRGSGPKDCCYRFTERKMPLKNVVSYTKVSQRCPIAAYRLKTEAKRQLCVRSSAPWLREIIEHVDSKTNVGEMSTL